jgi:hypothetical protein
LNPGCEISSLLDGKLARWSIASCALALACWPSISKIKKIKKKLFSSYCSRQLRPLP